MPTTNPVPSTDPSDLLFNAGKLDEVVNGTANSFTDRLGATRRTVAGMNADFDAQLADAESDLNVYRADAAASAAEALGYLQTIRATSYGAYAEDPTTDPLGNPPTEGDEYWNTTAKLLKRWNGTTWQASDISTANLAASSGSSLIGFEQEGPDAAPTTAQEKMRRNACVSDFIGADPTGATDSTAAFLSAAALARYVQVPKGTWRVQTRSLPSNTHFYGEGALTVIVPLTNNSSCALGCESGSNTAFISDISFRQMLFMSDVGTSGFSEHKHLLSLNGVRRAYIEHCGFIGFRGDAIYIGAGVLENDDWHNRDVFIRHCYFDGINKDNRNGISVIDGDGVTIEHNTFVRCSRPDMPGPICVEPDRVASLICRNITIQNNRIEDCGGLSGSISVFCPLAYGVGAMTTPPENIKILNNTIYRGDGGSGIWVMMRNAVTPVAVSDSVTPHDVEIHGNTVHDGKIILGGVRGGSVFSNKMRGTNAIIFVGNTAGATDNCMEVDVFKNDSRYVTGIYGGICIGTANRVRVFENRLAYVSQELAKRAICLIGDGVTTISSDISIFSNEFIGDYTAHVYSGSHTNNAASTYIYDNTKAGGGEISITAGLGYSVPTRAKNGTFTPQLIDTSGAMTFTQTASGSYSRVGDIVFCSFTVSVSAISGTGGTALRISGLPFTSNASTGSAIVPLSISAVDIPTGYSRVAAIVPQGQNYITLRQQGDNIADAGLSVLAVTTATSISGSFAYRV